ncbi:MAG: QueT transporter family protein [Saccharofermentanales bacterium]|jgi:uncharacterized membrane protein|nr:QueT transporter family protein [Clostridiales bacterium]
MLEPARFGSKDLTKAGIIAALYVILTLPFAQFSYGIVQFRLAEILAVLPILSSAAIPGVFVGCLLANLLNPQSLGPIDVLAGSLATLLAAWQSYKLGWIWRRSSRRSKATRIRITRRHIIALLPPIVINALVVGMYLPFLLLDKVTVSIVASSIGSIALTQTIVIIILGLPLLLAVFRTGQLRG